MASVAKRKWTHKGVEKEAWAVRYKDRTGAYRQKTFPRKKDADAYRAKVETELNDGLHIARRESRTIREVSEAILEEVDELHRKGVLRAGTVRNYNNAFRLWIIPEFGSRAAVDIKPSDVEEWVRAMSRTGKLSPRSITHRLWYLKAAFELAVRRRWVAINPCLAVRRELTRLPPPRIRDLTANVVRLLLSTSGERRKWSHPRAHLQRQCAVALAAFCGLRFGEIMGLQAKNLDLDRAMLKVRTGIYRDGRLSPPKTPAANRTVGVPAPLVTLLRRWMEVSPPADGEALVFLTDNGRPVLQPNFYLNAWRPLLKQAGLDDDRDPPHFHALRHFAGSWMIENGWPLPDVAKALGHSDISMTLRVYAHTIAGRAESLTAVNTLAGNLLSPNIPEATLIDANPPPAMTQLRDMRH